MLAIDIPQGAGTATRIELLCTNHPDRRAGKTTQIHSGFRNYFSEGDTRLRREMENANLRLQVRPDTQGRLCLQVVKVEPVQENTEQNSITGLND